MKLQLVSSMALALAIIGVVVGITLGLRFKVLILAPAIGVAEIFALIVGITRGGSFGSIVLAMVIVNGHSTGLLGRNILGEPHSVAALIARTPEYRRWDAHLFPRKTLIIPSIISHHTAALSAVEIRAPMSVSCPSVNFFPREKSLSCMELCKLILRPMALIGITTLAITH
jgi:hypothetical protein